MDFKSLLQHLNQLSEAETRKIAGRAYGGAAQHDDEDDDSEDSNTKAKAPAEKRGRGRPKKVGGEAETTSKYGFGKELQGYIVGNIPKKLPGKPGKKHTLKDWVEQVEANYMAEGSFKDREMRHELGHETSGSTYGGDRYFYSVPPDQEYKAMKLGLSVTDDGRWYSLNFRNHSADQIFGRGKLDSLGRFREQGVAEDSEQHLVYISDDRVEAFEDWMESEGLETNVPKRKEGTYVVYDYSNADHTSNMYAGEWNEKRGVAESADQDKGRPYVCVHAKKGKCNVTAKSSYEAAQQAAKKWGLKSTAGIDAYLADVTHKAVNEYKLKEAAPGQQLTVKPMPGAAQLVDPATQKVMATGDAAAVKNIQGAVAQGKVQMRGTQEEMTEEGEKWIKGAIKHPGAFAKKAKSHGMTPSAFASKVLSNKKDYPAKTEKQAQLAKTLGKLKKEDVAEADIPSDQMDMGAGLGAGRSQKTFEGAKPDYIDLDKDGNKKETMKKAATDKKKKKVNEGSHRHSSARLLGKSHALAKEGYNCKFDDLDEARMYHEGYKEGLDECYGQGVYESPSVPPATLHGMADEAMEAAFDEGNAFTGALAKTPKGSNFTIGGKSFIDRSNYDSKLDELAFESLDKQLTALLESEEVAEGMTISISKGQQGMPNSVTVSAQDGDADELLGLIKQAGLGLFGDESPSGYSVTDDTVADSHGDIKVVGDHDGMMSIMKKLAGTSGTSNDSEDYADEEDHSHVEDHSCGTCGQSSCECDEEQVREVESYDQEEEQVAEENPRDDEEESSNESVESEKDKLLSSVDDEGEEQVTEWANDADNTDSNKETFEADLAFITKTISGGLNKPKSTGQTTAPVIAGQTNRMVTPESISDWKKLAGI